MVMIEPESMASIGQWAATQKTSSGWKKSTLDPGEMVRSICLACVFILLLSCYLLPFCFARDTISTLDAFLSEGETIISAGERFELGFFTTGNKTIGFRRYVGIWYRSDPKIIVWENSMEIITA